MLPVSASGPLARAVAAARGQDDRADKAAEDENERYRGLHDPRQASRLGARAKPPAAGPATSFDAGPVDTPQAREATICEAQMSRQAVTKHLQVLADAHIVTSARSGRENVWTLAPNGLDAARSFVDAISREWDSALGRLRELVEVE